MSEAPPTGAHPILIALAAGFVGLIGGYAFHELAGFRPFVPPILSGGSSMACADLDAYVAHVSELQDHRLHKTTFGIHRQNTVDAVNELYDRARCGAHPIDDLGHEGYTTLNAKIEQDVNDPGPHSGLALPPAEIPRSYPLYSHGVLVSPPTADAPPSPTTSAPKAYVTSRRHGVYGSLPRRTYTSLDEEGQAGTPAGAAAPDGTPPRCHKASLPGQPDWQESGPVCPE